jgi:hypothetical protein
MPSPFQAFEVLYYQPCDQGAGAVGARGPRIWPKCWRTMAALAASRPFAALGPLAITLLLVLAFGDRSTSEARVLAQAGAKGPGVVTAWVRSRRSTSAHP